MEALSSSALSHTAGTKERTLSDMIDISLNIHHSSAIVSTMSRVSESDRLLFIVPEAGYNCSKTLLLRCIMCIVLLGVSRKVKILL